MSGLALNDVYKVMKAFLDKELCKAGPVISIVTDLWTSLGGQGFITIILRYMSEFLGPCEVRGSEISK